MGSLLREAEVAWADLAGRGKDWIDRARHGLAALARPAPELGAATWLNAKNKSQRKTARRNKQ